MSGRMIDPVQDAERAGYRAEGVRSQRDMEERDESSLRFNDDRGKQRIIVQETIYYFRDDVVANADNTMRVATPTAKATWDSTGMAVYVPSQARVIFGRLHSDASVTAGTAQLMVRITEDGTPVDYPFEGIELNTTDPRTMAAKFDWANALQIAAGGLVLLLVRTDASFAPGTTLNMAAWITLGYEEWISS